MGKSTQERPKYNRDNIHILKAIVEGLLSDIQKKQKYVESLCKNTISEKEWESLLIWANEIYKESNEYSSQSHNWKFAIENEDINNIIALINSLKNHSDNLISSIKKIKPIGGSLVDQDSLKIYEALYNIIDKLKSTAPWKWMYDTELIVIDHPNGNKYYGSILGNLGEFYACHFHIDNEGINAFNELASSSIYPEDKLLSIKSHLFMSQKLIGVSYESKKEISVKDEDVFKALGRKYKGNFGYPVVRIHEPGYQPRIPDIDDMHLLTCLIEKLIDIAEKHKESINKNEKSVYEKGKWLGTQGKFVGKDIQWKSKNFKMWEPKIEAYKKIEINHVKLELIRRQNFVKDGSWELDGRYIPAVINEDPRPYFGQLILIIDDEGMIISSPGISRPNQLKNVMGELLLDTIIKQKTIPDEIHVRHWSDRVHLYQISDALGIDIYQTPEFEYLDDAMEECIQFMRKNC